jgi:hypothetical protein
VWSPTIVPPELASWVLQPLLDALVVINVQARLHGYRIPLLYQSGTRYEAEPEGSEQWLCSPEAYKRRRADCEDLSCWLASDYRSQGQPARAVPIPQRRSVSGGRLFHVVCDRGNGSLEDPSRILGM